MKQLGGVFIVTALAGLAAGVDAAELRTQGYTNADLVGGYACDVSGTFGGSDWPRVVRSQARAAGDRPSFGTPEVEAMSRQVSPPRTRSMACSG